MFSLIKDFFYLVFYQPLLNILAVLVLVLPGHSFGAAIILLTVFVNTILLPFSHKAKHSQKKIQELHGEFEKIKRQFKDKREELARRQLELYREHGISLSSQIILPLIQIPLFISLYSILQQNGDFFASGIYSFLPHIPNPNPYFLGLIDLSQAGVVFHMSPTFVFSIVSISNIALALLAAVLQYIQFSYLTPPSTTSTKTQKDESFGAMMQKSMKINFPIIIFILGVTLPAALALYWTVMNIFGIVHEKVVLWKQPQQYN